jgi:hypothetical protein
MGLQHINKIGGQTFVSLDGIIDRANTKVEVFFRNGLNGVGIRNLGVKGEPFRLTSLNFHTIDDGLSAFFYASAEMDIYNAMVGGGAVPVIRHSIKEGDFYVIDVQEAAPPLAVVNALVGDVFFSNDAVIQTVHWTLIQA